PRCTPAPATADHQTPSAALLENLGDLETWRGNPEKGSEYLDKALQLYQKEADSRGIASVLRKQTVAAFRISDMVRLGAIATTTLEQCRTLHDALGMAEASFYIGHSAYLRGDGDAALPNLRESLETYRTLGDDVGIVSCLERISCIQREKGELQEALSTLTEAVQIASRSGDRLGLANTLHMLGWTYMDLSDFAKAADALSEAIAITRSVGWDGELCNDLLAMGRLKMKLGDYREAEEHYQESIFITRRIRDLWGTADGLNCLGDCLEKQFKLEEAAAAWEESCLLWQQQSQQQYSTRVASFLVDLKSSQRDWDCACFWLDHTIAVCRSQKDHWALASRLAQKARILVKAQRFDEAALHFEASIMICIENGYYKNEELEQLCAVPKTAMKWERRLPLLCDVKKLQRRVPQLTTSVLKLPIPIHALPQSLYFTSGISKDA
ncbi:hypothetical protein FS837_007428, partial [Tulasnella sp. UAMH 9824]